jgi:hypothetical protein
VARPALGPKAHSRAGPAKSRGGMYLQKQNQGESQQALATPPLGLGLDAEKRVADGRGRVAVSAELAADHPASVAGDRPVAVDDGAGAGGARPGWAFPAAAGTCSWAVFWGVAGADAAS